MRYYYDDDQNLLKYPTEGKIHFENDIQRSIWENFILGQLSDGMWENECVDYKFWFNLEPIVDGTLGWEHERGPTDERLSYSLIDLIEISSKTIEEYAKLCKIGITNPFECQVIHYYQNGYDYSHLNDSIKSIEGDFKSINKAFLEYIQEEYSQDDMKYDLEKISESMKIKRS